MLRSVESKNRTHHGLVGSGRRIAGRRGGAGMDRTGRRWEDDPEGFQGGGLNQTPTEGVQNHL